MLYFYLRYIIEYRKINTLCHALVIKLYIYTVRSVYSTSCFCIQLSLARGAYNREHRVQFYQHDARDVQNAAAAAAIAPIAEADGVGRAALL